MSTHYAVSLKLKYAVCQLFLNKTGRKKTNKYLRIKLEAVWSPLKTQFCHRKRGCPPTWGTPVKYSLGQVFQTYFQGSTETDFSSHWPASPAWWSWVLKPEISSLGSPP